MKEEAEDSRKYWETRSSEINFLKEKLQWLADQIEAQYQEFPEDLPDLLDEEYGEGKRRLLEEKLQEEWVQERVKEGGGVLVEEWRDLEPPFMAHPMFYFLDSYIYERRRFVEFSLKVCQDYIFAGKGLDRPHENYEERIYEEESVSVGSFLDHVKGEYSSKSRLVSYLEEKHPEFLGFIKDNMEWFEESEKSRTMHTHYGIDIGLDQFGLDIEYSPPFDIDSPDSVSPPEELTMSGEKIPQKLERDLEIMESLFHKVNEVIEREKPKHIARIRLENALRLLSQFEEEGSASEN